MNRSSKGFGLTGVAIAVLFMIVTAAFSTSAQSSEISNNAVHITSK
ncbi:MULTISPECIES: hypothetical protein [Marisediminitalea]|jgi:hypothetical protein|nr:hypothetical protein [Marisediminitalea aggregata]MCP9480221.1 hypothetical protein [Marisediminitalea aggregata]|tara:strand:- start:2220 stop:2357 length:138 start_codon:yes stop_codon:yes gene_type:complete